MHASRKRLVKLRKIQAATKNKNAKCSFCSVQRELTGTDVNNSKDRTGADHQRERKGGGGGGGEEEKGGRWGQYKRTAFTQKGKQKQKQYANVQFHTLW